MWNKMETKKNGGVQSNMEEKSIGKRADPPFEKSGNTAISMLSQLYTWLSIRIEISVGNCVK